MATKVFVSFRFSDGESLKEELINLFDSSTEVINRSEDEDRSEMTEETIRKYLYEKLKSTSVTIVILTPEAIEYKKDWLGRYDDWLYDELRYSLEDRSENRTNGAIALYTDDSVGKLMRSSTHSCNVCERETNITTILQFNNLVRKNMLNIKSEYKTELCEDLYNSEKDSYISLIHFDEFKKDYKQYIEAAKAKRDRKNEFNLVKRIWDSYKRILVVDSKTE